MKELFKEDEIPKEHLKEIKNFTGAYEFVTGRIDEYNAVVSVWTHGGVYKIIRAFILSGKDTPVISVDCDMANAHSIMAKLLLRYNE